MSYTHLTIYERAKIKTYLDLGYSIRRIAVCLKRSPSTISRELRRHTDCSAEEAQARYQTNKSNCGAKLKLTTELKEAVQEKLNDTWSPVVHANIWLDFHHSHCLRNQPLQKSTYTIKIRLLIISLFKNAQYKPIP